MTEPHGSMPAVVTIRPQKRNWRAVGPVVVATAVAFALIWTFGNLGQEPSLRYNVQVHTASPSMALVLELPLPVLANGTVVGLMNVIPRIIGNVMSAGVELGNAGPVLRIVIQGPVELEWQGPSPLRGDWPLPLNEHFPGGNPDLNQWNGSTPGATSNEVGSVRIFVKSANSTAPFEVDLTFLISRGACNSLIHQATFRDVDSVGWHYQPLGAFREQCF